MLAMRKNLNKLLKLNAACIYFSMKKTYCILNLNDCIRFERCELYKFFVLSENLFSKCDTFDSTFNKK